MKLAVDPYMLRDVPLTQLPGLVADLGYEYIELSPREDFTPFFLHPRANADVVASFKKALNAAGVKIASHPAVVPVVGGLTRTSGRQPSGTGSGRFSSPSTWGAT